MKFFIMNRKAFHDSVELLKHTCLPDEILQHVHKELMLVLVRDTFEDALLSQKELQDAASRLFNYVMYGISSHRTYRTPFRSDVTPVDYYLDKIQNYKEERDYNIQEWAKRLLEALGEGSIEGDCNLWNECPFPIAVTDITLNVFNSLRKVIEEELHYKFLKYNPFKVFSFMDLTHHFSTPSELDADESDDL